jgi:hypothetical protein
MDIKEIQLNKLQQDLDDLTVLYSLRYKNKELFLINYLFNVPTKSRQETLMFMIKIYQGSLKSKMTWQKFLKSKKYSFNDPETATEFY